MGKRRPRNDEDPYERIGVDACRRLRRAAKLSKAFLSRKLIRKLKGRAAADPTAVASGAGDDGEGGDQAPSRRGQELEALKVTGLDPVVSEGLRWLGLPEKYLEMEKAAAKHAKQRTRANSDVDLPPRHVAERPDAGIVHQIFNHNKVQTELRLLSEKVREQQRRDIARREGVRFVSNKRMRKETAGETESRAADMERVGTSAVFMTSLSGKEEQVIGDGAEEGPDAAPKKAKKKNRPGQRKRREKFEEDQRRRAKDQAAPGSAKGRAPQRPPAAAAAAAAATPSATPAPARGVPGEQRAGATTGAAKGAASKGTQQMHPSWVAKQKMKERSGISAFAGTKITFD